MSRAPWAPARERSARVATDAAVQLDVVRVAEHDDGPDRGLGDRGMDHAHLLQPPLPGLELRQGAHAECEVIEAGAQLVERTLFMAEVLADAQHAPLMLRYS